MYGETGCALHTSFRRRIVTVKYFLENLKKGLDKSVYS